MNVVTELKEKYPHLVRIYVRAEFEHINKDFYNYLLELYDKTYYPEIVRNSGKLAYIARNEEMIDNSDVCIFYYNENYQPLKRKSGTKIALEYARQHKKRIIIFN